MAGYESDETQNQCTGKLDSGDILTWEKPVSISNSVVKLSADIFLFLLYFDVHFGLDISWLFIYSDGGFDTSG